MFKKYFISSELDRSWGLVVHNIGKAQIPKGRKYPTDGHPSNYMFTWETGRVLETYHIIFILKGEGVFESYSYGHKKIEKGDAFLLFPDEWHRYKPLKRTGWTEIWVGFSGPISDNILHNFFCREEPVIQNCMNLKVANLMESLLEIMEAETFGSQRIASGICLQLFAEIYNVKERGGAANQTESLISKTKLHMTKKIDETIDFHDFSKEVGVSYSKLRSDFRKETGYAPLQYFLLLKIEKAKDLLKRQDLKSKEIAYLLGFKSQYYFSRIFKNKTGYTTGEYRKKIITHNSSKKYKKENK